MYVFYVHNQKSAFTTHHLYGCLSLWFYSCQLPSEGFWVSIKLDSASSFLVPQMKEFACKAEDLGWSLGWEDPLEKEMAIQSNILAWEIPWKEEPTWIQSMGL